MGAGRRFSIAENFNPLVDLFFELVFVDEAIDLHGAEEMGRSRLVNEADGCNTRVGGV